jgi:TPR repeat protein
VRSLIISIAVAAVALSSADAGQPTDAELVRQADTLAAHRKYKQAAVLYEKAAGHGYPAAECKLGKAYTTAQGVPLNFTLGKQWLKRAAAHGSKEAKYALEDLQKLEEIGGFQLQ